MNNQAAYERIEKYLDNELSEEQRAQFEKEVETDPELQQGLKDLINLRFAAHDLLKDQYAGKFAKWKEESSGEVKVRPLTNWYLAAAASLLLLVAAWWLLGDRQASPQTLQELYALHVEPIEVSGARGQSDPSLQALWQKAIRFYAQKDYHQAAKAFEDLLGQLPDGPAKSEPWLYLGTCYLFNYQSQKAIEAFGNVAPESEASFEAEWYTALAYLKTEDLAKAREVLQKISDSPAHWKNKNAKMVLEKLDHM